MSRTFDISLSIHPEIVTYPGESPPVHTFVSRLEEHAPANVSRVSLGIHTATHVDTPLHFLDGSDSVEQLPVDRYSGRCLVLDLTEIQSGNIEEEHLKSIDGVKDESILLFKTRNSSIVELSEFQAEYCGVGLSAAQWLASNSSVRTVGIDYLSIEAYGDRAFPVHHTLLENDILAIEGLLLKDVPAGYYDLTCLPLKISGAEGAPARAMLKTIDS